MQQIPTLCLVEYQWRIDEKRNNRKVPLYLGSRTERAEYRSAWNVRLDTPIKRKEKRWNNKPTHKTVAKLCHLKRVRLLFLPTAHCLISIVQTVSNSIKLFTKQMNRATISVPLSIRIVYDRQQKEEVRKKKFYLIHVPHPRFRAHYPDERVCVSHKRVTPMITFFLKSKY